MYERSFVFFVFLVFFVSFVVASVFVPFAIFVSFVFQKSICALTLANRGVSTIVGVSHGPFGTKVWL